jgi:sugar phosphate isomerase/epimerase
MEFMVCLNGETDQHSYFSEIADLGAGIELGGYGLAGVRSQRDWDYRLEKHIMILNKFQGKAAMHGPFIGIEYSHIDHLIRESIQRRIDMTFNAACTLKVSRVILHSGYNLENEVFHLNEIWLNENINYWKKEICRWEKAGIEIVLENDVEKSPDLLIDLVKTVKSPSLQLCLDIGHLHYLSPYSSLDWVNRMGSYLKHVHIHDNDQKADRHWPIGKGTIDFEAFCSSIENNSPDITLSIEVEGTMEDKMNDLRRVINRFRK